MTKGYGGVRQRRRAASKAQPGELVQLLGRWVPLPQRFGDPKRNRLFSPLTHLLAVLGSGARR